MTEEVRLLLEAYAIAVVTNNKQAYTNALNGLETLGLRFAGYVGRPVLCNATTVVAQVAFNYNKDNTLSKRHPYTVMELTQKEEIQHGN